MKFIPSGLIADINNLEEIEFFGHDAGEFVPVEEMAEEMTPEELEEVLDQQEGK